jgi:hypothetical protein
MRIEKHPILDDLPERRQVHITVDGRKLEAYEGESIAAALFAAGIKIHRTTPKYHAEIP